MFFDFGNLVVHVKTWFIIVVILFIIVAKNSNDNNEVKYEICETDLNELYDYNHNNDEKIENDTIISFSEEEKLQGFYIHFED